MVFTLFGQMIAVGAAEYVSIEDRKQAVKHLVFSEPFYRACNFLSDFALAVMLAAFGRFFWATICAVSLLMTSAIIGKSYGFIAEMKKDEKPEPRECGCQHCN